jgi:hypothetical protein
MRPRGWFCKHTQVHDCSKHLSCAVAPIADFPNPHTFLRPGTLGLLAFAQYPSTNIDSFAIETPPSLVCAHVYFSVHAPTCNNAHVHAVSTSTQNGTSVNEIVVMIENGHCVLSPTRVPQLPNHCGTVQDCT